MIRQCFLMNKTKTNDRNTTTEYLKKTLFNADKLMRLKVIFSDFFSISDGSCWKLCHDPQLTRENVGQFIATI